MVADFTSIDVELGSGRKSVTVRFTGSQDVPSPATVLEVLKV